MSHLNKKSYMPTPTKLKNIFKSRRQIHFLNNNPKESKNKTLKKVNLCFQRFKNIETLYEDYLRCKCDFKEYSPLSLFWRQKQKKMESKHAIQVMMLP